MSWKLQMSITFINLHVSNHLVPFGWALRVVSPLAWHDITMYVIEVGGYLVFFSSFFPTFKGQYVLDELVINDFCHFEGKIEPNTEY